jgi:hypothetical protein
VILTRARSLHNRPRFVTGNLATMAEDTIDFQDSLDPATNASWNSYWATSNHSAPRQNAQYGEVERLQGHRAIYAIGRKSGRVAFIALYGLIPFLSENIYSEAVCLRGPVFDDSLFGQWCLVESLKHFSRLRIGRVRIGPRWIFPEAQIVEAMLFRLGFQPFERRHPLGRRSTGFISIDATDQALLQSFSKSTRYQVRLAERMGIRILEATDRTQAEVFFSHIRQMYLGKGLGDLRNGDFFPVFERILKDRQLGVLFNAYIDATYLGGLYLTRDNQTVYTYQFVVADEAIRRFPTMRLAPIMFFQGMKWGRSLGCSILDFEGYSAGLEGAGDLALVYLYKHGFRPMETQLLGQYIATIRKEIEWLVKLKDSCFALIRGPQRVLAKLKAYSKKRAVITSSTVEGSR